MKSENRSLSFQLSSAGIKAALCTYHTTDIRPRSDAPLGVYFLLVEDECIAAGIAPEDRVPGAAITANLDDISVEEMKRQLERTDALICTHFGITRRSIHISPDAKIWMGLFTDPNGGVKVRWIPGFGWVSW